MSHKWEPTDRRAWTRFGALLTVYECGTCGRIHGGRPHRGRCGDGCGNFYPSGGGPSCSKKVTP